MDKSRLAKLAALTQGIALLTTSACDRSQSGESTQPPMQPAINAPPQPPTDPAAASATGAPAPTDDTQTAPTGSVPIRRFPIPNAPPGRRLPRDQGDAGP